MRASSQGYRQLASKIDALRARVPNPRRLGAWVILDEEAGDSEASVKAAKAAWIAENQPPPEAIIEWIIWIPTDPPKREDGPAPDDAG